MARNFTNRFFRSADRGSAVRFVVVGMAATAIHYGVYYALLGAGALYTPAYVSGYAVSLVFNFFATGRFTFRTSLDARKGALFLFCHAVNFALHVSLLRFFVAKVGLGEKIAPIFVLCIAVPVNYILVRRAMRDKTIRHEHDR